MKLTVKQQRFCDEYIISGNASDAARKAGYSERSAYAIGEENLRKPDIRRYIDERLAQLASEKIADQEETLQYLTAVMRGETESEVVVVEGKGDGYSKAKRIKKAPDEKDRLKAAELLGKRHGLFTDVQKIGLEKETLAAMKENISLSDKLAAISAAKAMMSGGHEDDQNEE